MYTPRKSHASPEKSRAYGVSSMKRRRRKPRNGAIPVPVATMIRSVVGDASGNSITLPVGPVIVSDVPGVASQRKFEQIPFFAGSMVWVSGSQ